MTSSSLLQRVQELVDFGHRQSYIYDVCRRSGATDGEISLALRTLRQERPASPEAIGARQIVDEVIGVFRDPIRLF